MTQRSHAAIDIRVSAPTQTMRECLRERLGRTVAVEYWVPGESPAPGFLDLAVMPYSTDPQSLRHLSARTVRVAQLQTLGYDGVSSFLPPGVVLCNAVGVHEGPAAEMALTLVLASQRGWPDVAGNQRDHDWAPRTYPGLLGQRVLLIGTGGIGREIEQRLAPFGVDLDRVGRTARIDGDAVIYAVSEVGALLPHADVVILAVPLTSETHHLVGEAFLTAMKPGALLVNVSRGLIVDSDALIAHVRTGRIRAALDVVEPEPLPADSPLWGAPGVVITPHLGGDVASRESRVETLVSEQVARLQSGSGPNFVVGGPDVVAASAAS